ncbi:MAG: hypothetical protein JW913_02135, partial [Chitinispirillaceae bacterium]|nr:hypothetical protein [Chitinispirillaceae bacterium]
MLTNKIAATGMMLAIIGGVFAQQKAAVPATAKTTPATAVAKTDTAKKQPATPAKPAATKQTPATAVAKT